MTTFLHEQIVQKPSQEKKQALTPQSKVVADQVAKLVHSAEALKGNSLCSHMIVLTLQGRLYVFFCDVVAWILKTV